MPLIPLAPGTQEAVSGAFARPAQGQSFGDILDAMLALRATGQKQVSDAFEAITRGNPALAAFLAAQPGFVEGLTAAPTLRGKPQGPALAKQIQEGTAKFNGLQAEDANVMALTPQQFSEISQDALKDLNFEGLDPQSQKNILHTYFALRTTKHPEVRVKAAAMLAEQGVLPKEQKGIAVDIGNVMDLVNKFPDEMARIGITDEVSAFTALRQTDLKEVLLRQQIALATVMLSKGEQIDPTIMRGLLNDRDAKKKMLAEVTSQLEQIAATKTMPADARGKAQADLMKRLGLGGEGPEAEAALREQAASLEASITEIDGLVTREKKKGPGAPTPPSSKKRLSLEEIEAEVSKKGP